MNRVYLLLLASLLLPVPALADTATPDFNTETLSGDWGGTRTNLYKKGYDFEIMSRLDLWRNFSGGVKTGNRALNELDLKMSVDGAKAFDLDGTSFFVHVLNNTGGRINELAGTNGGIDNIETPTPTFKLYEAWAQKEFYDGRLSVLAGLHDLNTEFYVTDTSGLFLNPTYGIGTEMAVTGDNGPSVLPSTGLALRVAVKPTEDTYVQAALFEGTPGKAGKTRGTHIDLQDKEGLLEVIEGGFKSEETGHFGVGLWQYTAKRPDTLNANDTSNSHGVYFLADHAIFSADDRQINGFARLGFTSGAVEQFSRNWSLGLVGDGWVPQRPDAQIGLAVTRNTNTSKYIAANGPLDKSETQVELTYKDTLTPLA